jgi:hypothetical protein
MALARSHDMLTEGGWEGAALHEVAQRKLAAYGVHHHGLGPAASVGAVEVPGRTGV